MPRLIGKTPAPARLGSPGMWTLQQASDATRDVRWPGVWRNNLLAVVSTATPYLRLYGRNTVYGDNNPPSQPAALSFAPNDVAWSMSGGHLAVVGGTAQMAWYSHNAGVLTLLSNPATMPVGTVISCAWSPDDQFLAVAHTISPFITIYQRSGDTLTKLTNPGTLPAGFSRQCAWSPSGEFLAVAHQNSPGMTVYQRSGTTFTKLSDPATLPVSYNGWGCAWSSADNLLAIGSGFGAAIYELAGTTLTKVGDTPGIPSISNSGECQFSPDGNFLSISTATANGIFQRSGLTFTLLSSPRNSTGNAAWSRDSQFLAGGVSLYSISGSTFTLQTALSPAPAGTAVAFSFL